ncbi:patched family protein [Ancylostoma duodenale]|uniref:Patched family protein n=1 Tax=Ancylostoma duodenale TaxID=51022 RepID=A0A0C2GHU9_9BILA|nr:patched family protein [Ancylostoma duodenale]
MCITPFLVMGIGVDDAFLLLHAWRRHSDQPVKERMRIVVLQIGPSMAITSATNTLAFGVGITSPTPQMSGFCLCTCLAIFLDFLFEFLIFAPTIVLFFSAKEKKPAKIVKRWISWEKYTNILLSPCGRISVIIFTIFLYGCAFVGVSDLKPSFDPSKTFPYDSDLMVSLEKFEKVQSEYAPLNFISALPDLSDTPQLALFMEMVERLEYSEGCYGPERTQILLRDYIEWEESKNNSLSFEELPKFLSERQIKDKNIVQYETVNGTIGQVWMNYIVICRGDLDWNRRAMKIDKMRKIIDQYPQFQTSLFDYDSTIYDLIITVKDELIKAVLITFVCMTLACAFMIPSLTGASLATLSMLSISFCKLISMLK